MIEDIPRLDFQPGLFGSMEIRGNESAPVKRGDNTLIERAIECGVWAKMSDVARAIYPVLCSYVDTKLIVKISVPEMMKYSGLSESSVKRAKHWLIRNGMMYILENGSRLSDGTYNPTTFQLDSLVTGVCADHSKYRSRKVFRQQVFRRDLGHCRYCNSIVGRDFILDQVIPRELGGKFSITNLVACCKACHDRKGGRSPVSAGMLVRPLRLIGGDSL